MPRQPVANASVWQSAAGAGWQLAKGGLGRHEWQHKSSNRCPLQKSGSSSVEGSYISMEQHGSGLKTVRRSCVHCSADCENYISNDITELIEGIFVGGELEDRAGDQLLTAIPVHLVTSYMVRA